MIDVNLTGVWHTKAATPAPARGRRRLHHLHQLHGRPEGDPTPGHYNSAKHGVVG